MGEAASRILAIDQETIEVLAVLGRPQTMSEERIMEMVPPDMSPEELNELSSRLSIAGGLDSVPPNWKKSNRVGEKIAIDTLSYLGSAAFMYGDTRTASSVIRQLRRENTIRSCLAALKLMGSFTREFHKHK